MHVTLHCIYTVHVYTQVHVPCIILFIDSSSHVHVHVHVHVSQCVSGVIVTVKVKVC